MTPVRAAKAELRKVIRNALSSMSPEQKQSETESLVMKVSNTSVELCSLIYLFMCSF